MDSNPLQLFSSTAFVDWQSVPGRNDLSTLRPAKMCVQLYADDVEFEFNLEQNKNRLSPAITQADLNRIIQTAHKAALIQSIVTVNPG